MPVQRCKRGLAVLLAGCLVLAAAPAASGEEAAPVGAVNESAAAGPAPWTVPADAVAVPAAVMTAEGAENVDGIWKVDSGGALTFSVTVPAAGRYQLALRYRLAEGSANPLETAVILNGTDLGTFDFPRVYEDRLDESGKMEEDSRGNDVKPRQVTAERFFTLPLRAYDTRAGEDYWLDLAGGENVFRLAFSDQTVEVEGAYIFQGGSLPAYTAPASPTPATDGLALTLEAEYARYKSNSTLYPVTDRASVATTPSHWSAIKLNTIGGSNWTEPGDWISWQFHIDTPGYYAITLRVRQNLTRGMRSTRRIYIDGRIPFAELDGYAFPYDRNWRVETLGKDGEDFYFYFDEGDHTLMMEAAMGEMLDVSERLEEVIYQLNQLYLQIIKITGTSPDIYRTYDLNDKIPNLQQQFTRLLETINGIAGDYEKKANSVGTNLSFLREMAVLIESYIKNDDKIPTSLDTFKNDIATLSSLLSDLRQQPLQLDKIQISGRNSQLMPAEAGFWDSLVHGVRSFFASFVTDYSVIGDDGDTGTLLKVWMTSGRDQAQVLKAMIDDTFTPETGISVQLSMIQAGLTEATMAGKGPDIALGVARTIPMDLGVRGVLADLSEYEGLDAIRDRYQKSAFKAYTYRDKVYGIPETQEFGVMFLRTDILDDLELTPPRTWDDMTGLITILSQNNMQVGVPQTILSAMLVQNGMSYYEPDLSKTVFSSEKAYSVYENFIRMYRDYEQPYYFDAANRFKTGEMPVVIGNFSLFNTISVLAPELRGYWDMTELPGTRLEDGTISNGTDASGVASILFKKCADKQAAYRFLDWWGEEETQVRYGTELEKILGPAGRYSAANGYRSKN